MKNYALCVLFSFILVAPLPFAQTNTSINSASTQTSPIPEEARKHFVMGMTLFKEAKTADDFTQVVSEFKQAADLAPQWPDPRYNLALAKEAAGDYSGATADLKLYQQFKLSDSEARTVQDKIYALEAKAGVAAKKQAEEQKAAAAEQQKKRDYQERIGFLEGTWNCHSTQRAPNGKQFGYDFKVTITVSGKSVGVTGPDRSKPFAKGIIQGEDYTSIKWMAADDDDTHKDIDNNLQNPAPDIPINVVVDKAGPQIHFETPQVLLSMGVGSGSASWTMQFGAKKYTLMK